MLVDRSLSESASRTPDAVALIEPGRSIDYGALDRLANRFANLCVARGVRRGDRVVMALENGIELAAAWFGVMRAGAVAVPLASGPRNDRLAKAMADCAPAACIVDAPTAAAAGCLAALEPVPAVLVHERRRHPDGRSPSHASLDAALAASSDAPPGVRAIDQDLAAIIYTSGSTGEPRGVMLTHRNLVSNTRSIVQYLRLGPSDRVMCVLPFYYVYGLSLLNTHVAAGGSLVIENRFAYPSVVLQAMREHSVTSFAGVPSTFALLLGRPEFGPTELPVLRYVTQAGGAMAPARIREWCERVPEVPLYVMYGATEASARLTYLDPGDLPRKIGSIGRPIPNVEVLIVKEDGDEAGPGEVGELVARGSNVACGYWNDADGTRERFTPLGYRTGDLGSFDEEGYLFLAGRKHDMIKVGAHRVGAKEIEDVLHDHRAVREAAVVAASHEILGEVPVAFVALREAADASPDELRAFCARRLPPHKVPVRVVFTSDLPKLAGTGKIDRRALGEQAR